jgi:hypothetical protein
VDAPDHEHARPFARDVHHLDRSAVVGAAELLRWRGQQRGDDQGAQHHPAIVGDRLRGGEPARGTFKVTAFAKP